MLPAATLDEALADPARALRAGVEAIEAGDAERAQELLGEAASRYPLIADHADRLRLRAMLDAGQHDGAAALAAEAVSRHAKSPLLAELYGLLAEARLAAGDEAGARESWEASLGIERDREKRARLRDAIAASLVRTDQPDEAAKYYLVLWTHYPTTPEGAAAAERLDEREQQLETPLRTPQDLQKHADALYGKRRNEPALAAYDRALASELSKEDRARAQRRRAQTLFRLRRYDEAAESFKGLPESEENEIWYARSAARAGDVPTAVRKLEQLAERSRTRSGARARLLAAMLLEGKGLRKRAAALYEELVEKAPSSTYVTSALWRLGWAAYQEERYPAALDYFARLEEREEDAIAALRARYWHARAAERAGTGDVSAELSALALEYPLSYYGWRASTRVSDAPGRPEPVDLARGRSALAPRDLERPRILLQAGLLDETQLELARLFPRARSLSDRLELANLYTHAGNFNRAQRLMIDAYTEPLARGPSPDQLEPWFFAWPAAYREYVDGETKNGADLEQALLYAVMREESGYRPAVISPNGARGLLQLMPETAARMARLEGLRGFQNEDLFKPDVNVKLGSAYLAQLVRRFDGRLSAAIGGYNAGPTAVTEWLHSIATEADDEWVESIPYDQTRSYVKRVLRSLHAYRVLY